jgi:hypothetical protein
VSAFTEGHFQAILSNLPDGYCPLRLSCIQVAQLLILKVMATKYIITIKKSIMKKFSFILTVVAFYCNVNVALAQDHPVLHTSPRWEECSIQLDPSLTQGAFHQFTKEAALVTYFRPLTDAKPTGAKNFEFSILQWQTAIDDSDAAWNDTFVHISPTHYLFEGPRLAFPGLTFRAGVTKKLDVGAYFTKSPGANYGFYGGQLQYNLVNNMEKKWSASARASFMSLYGPQDVKFNSYGVDLIASKEFRLYSDWAFIAPYVSVSSYVSTSRETTEAVNLKNESAMGAQTAVGAVLKLSIARLGVEYNFAKVNSLSFKIGVAF